MFFLLAFFLDFFELAFILVPLVGPVAEKLGIDLIWFGVLLGVNMQTSFMHPPFGFALFYPALGGAEGSQDLGYLLGRDPLCAASRSSWWR
jgi:TRAP-type mannitol/chloroaromatic compound transport system permease large subunit